MRDWGEVMSQQRVKSCWGMSSLLRMVSTVRCRPVLMKIRVDQRLGRQWCRNSVATSGLYRQVPPCHPLIKDICIIMRP